MAEARRPFRIEMSHGAQAAQPAPAAAAPPDLGGEILRQLEELKRLVRLPQETAAASEHFRRQLAEAHALKKELDEIYRAIGDTKTEIASLRFNGFKGRDAGRVTDELDAVVVGTEQATEQILACAEAIDEAAAALAAQASGTRQRLAADIQERVVSVFEACNFQDLTGQRIGKVVGALRFIEARVARMMEIWGGIAYFDTLEGEVTAKRNGDAALLNGPALASDGDIASQDDIDALFA